jgi:hypothetical protein
MGSIHPSPGGFPRGRPALNLLGVIPILRCSARGCAAPAAWALRWNNPKLHPPDRRKVWLACPDHLDSLSAFLTARGFLREVVAAEAALPADGGAGGSTDGG